MTSRQWRQGTNGEEAQRRIANVRAKAADVEEAIGRQSAFCRDEPNSFAFRLTLKSFEARRAELLAELADAISVREREVLSLKLQGSAFPDHTASLAALSHVISRGQRLFTSIAQAISVGPTPRGPVPLGLQQISQLRLAGVGPGSFVMALEVDTAPDMHGESITVTALQTLFALVGTEAGTEALLARAGALGPRAMNHYKHWLQGLIKTGTSVALAWSDPFGREHVWDPGPNHLADTYAALERVRTESTEVANARGWLLGASLLRNRFEFLVDDSSGTIIAGRIAAESKDQVRKYFGERCEITYSTILTREQGGATSSRAITLTAVRANPTGTVVP
jgi:hypothetical protein